MVVATFYVFSQRLFQRRIKRRKIKSMRTSMKILSLILMKKLHRKKRDWKPRVKDLFQNQRMMKKVKKKMTDKWTVMTLKMTNTLFPVWLSTWLYSCIFLYLFICFIYLIFICAVSLSFFKARSTELLLLISVSIIAPSWTLQAVEILVN